MRMLYKKLKNLKSSENPKDIILEEHSFTFKKILIVFAKFYYVKVINASLVFSAKCKQEDR